MIGRTCFPRPDRASGRAAAARPDRHRRRNTRLAQGPEHTPTQGYKRSTGVCMRLVLTSWLSWGESGAAGQPLRCWDGVGTADTFLILPADSSSTTLGLLPTPYHATRACHDPLKGHDIASSDQWNTLGAQKLWLWRSNFPEGSRAPGWDAPTPWRQRSTLSLDEKGGSDHARHSCPLHSKALS